MLCRISTGLQGPQDLDSGTQGVGLFQGHMVSKPHADLSCVVPTSSRGQGQESPSGILSY